MTGWKEVNIGSLGEVVTGNTPPTADREYYGGHYPFIKPTDMDLDRRRVIKWEENFTEKAFKKYKNCYIPVGATGVVTIGTVGEKIFQADRKCFTNQSVNVVIPNSEYDPDFVYYLLKHNLPKVSAANPGTASGRHHVSKSNFCAIIVSVPKDKLVQTKIGQTLSAYDDLIESNLKRIKLLEELAQRTYEEWFVKFRVKGKALEMDERTGLPIGWSKKKLTSVCEKITDGTHDSPKPSNQGFKLITGKHLMGGYIDFESAYIISEEDHLKIKKRSGLKTNDILFSNIGTLGNIAMMNESFDYSCKNMIIFRPLINREYYLFAYLENKKNKERFLGQSSGSTQKFISLNYIRSYEDIIPTDEILTNFNLTVKGFYAMIFNLHTQNRYLKEARDILLPRLMNGTINVAIETQPLIKVIQLGAPPQKQATPQFKEAILISLLTSKFGNEKYPLGRMRYTKLSYLFHRYADNQIKDYLRKAAGPYNPKTKYGGPEKIAHDNGYVVDYKSGQLTGFIAGPNIEKAKPYFESYWDIDYLTWLEAQFKYKSNDDLELFATVDNSLIELNQKNEPFTVEAVKNILKKVPEWTAKLEREIFNDANILRAVTYLPTIFQY